jgi:uncharacterized protein (TIGR00661 family)
VETVLICPLDWGLGHASRNVVIIKKLLANKFKVIIGADKAPLAFLRTEFPELHYIKIPSVRIKYPKGKHMAFKMLLSVPKLLSGIYKEHLELKKIISQQKIDAVISDNRFGLWNKKLYSVFISHQIEIQTPAYLSFVKPIINKINHWFINKYDICWIPDLPEEEKLAGSLSQISGKLRNTKYIGLLSRFQYNELNTKKYDIALILSGPEPQRSIFEQIMVHEIRKTGYKAIVVLGKPKEKNIFYEGNIEYVNHLKTNELQQLILSSELVISRSGYSSIMDYVRLRKNAILVPTPGQTEQEYLAKRLMKKKWFYSISQYGFDLKKAINDCAAYQVPDINISTDLLEIEIRNLREKLYL